MDPSELPRFHAAQRRDFLKRAVALGAVLLVPGGLAACAKDDADTFADDTTTTDASATTAADGATTSSPGTETTEAPTTSGTLPEAATLEVAFTYTAAGGGSARNPFIAVWVEDEAGDLVANLSVWYNAPKGERWINNLSSWYAADSAYYQEHGSDDLEAVTGATRPAGTYTVAWDGTAATGERAPTGTYTVYVESAREHGPHSLTSAELTLGDAGATAPMPDDGELSAASAAYTV